MMSWDFCPISNTHTHTHIYIFINIIDDTAKYIDDTACIYTDRLERRLSESSQLFKEKELNGTIHFIICR